MTQNLRNVIDEIVYNKLILLHIVNLHAYIFLLCRILYVLKLRFVRQIFSISIA